MVGGTSVSTLVCSVDHLFLLASTEVLGSISTADGSALVRMGDTTMVCGIKAEITEPDASRPTEGIISTLSPVLEFRECLVVRWDCVLIHWPVPNIDLPALCSPKFKPGPPNEEAQVYSNWLYDLLITYVQLRSTPLYLILSTWLNSPSEP